MKGRFIFAAGAAWIASLASAAFAATVPAGGFEVHQVFSAGDVINNITDAKNLLDGSTAQSGYADASAQVIDFVDPDHPASGHFHNDFAFPGDIAGVDENNFALEATAHVIIPAAGTYTFGVTSDDGFSLQVGRFTMSFSSARGVGDTLASFKFPAAGHYDLTLDYFDRYNSAGVELYAGAGTITSATDPKLHLVGDVADGGLALNPEPSVLAPFVAVGFALSHKRRVR